MANKKGKDSSEGGGTIALNKRARHDYHLEDRYEAGLALQGWELKAIRAGRLNMGESYALVKNGEIFLFGAQITPLITDEVMIELNRRVDVDGEEPVDVALDWMQSEGLVT